MLSLLVLKYCRFTLFLFEEFFNPFFLKEGEPSAGETDLGNRLDCRVL